MEDYTTNWSREELKAYILLYCAHADFIVTKEEKEFIKTRVGDEKYRSINKEFLADTDYQHIQKIQATVEKYDYSETEIDRLFENIKKLFLADGPIDILEENIYMGLKHLLRK